MRWHLKQVAREGRVHETTEDQVSRGERQGNGEVAGIDSDTALVCHGGSSSRCYRLLRGGGGVSAPAGELVVHPGSASGSKVVGLTDRCV